MPLFTNEAPGPRGVNLTDGTTRWIDPGETVEIADADVADAHEDLTISAKPTKAKPDAE